MRFGAGAADNDSHPVAIEPVEEWLASNVPLVERLCRYVCRDTRMSPADVDEFVSSVLLKLVDDDYAVLRGYEGRAQMSSFLIVVIRRALSDDRAREHGKYRPSNEARRLGPAAVELEALLRRDGRSLDDALLLLRERGRPLQRSEGEKIARRLPERRPRPVLVPLEDELQLAVPDDDAERRVAAGERAATSRTVSASLREAIGELPAEEQTILRLWFVAGWSVADISRSMHLDQQQLYARLRRICKTMRARLLAAGVDAARVAELVGRTDVDLDFGLDGGGLGPQIPAPRPSSGQERGVADEEALR